MDVLLDNKVGYIFNGSLCFEFGSEFTIFVEF